MCSPEKRPKESHKTKTVGYAALANVYKNLIQQNLIMSKSLNNSQSLLLFS